MSQLFKTNLEEYARQCTLQRRRYEECLQQVEQSCTVNASAMPTGAGTQDAKAGAFVEDGQSDACMEQAVQSCMIDLLEMPAHLLGWDDEEVVSDEVRSEVTEEPQGYDNRAQASHQTVVNPTIKSTSPVGYGAP